MVPVSLDEQLLTGTLEHAIHEVVEYRLDMSAFASCFQNDETGKEPISTTYHTKWRLPSCPKP
jgi:hypothetical protein